MSAVMLCLIRLIVSRKNAVSLVDCEAVKEGLVTTDDLTQQVELTRV